MSARKAFVIGWPIAHSRSPLIHRFWLDRYGIAGNYVRQAIPPEGVDAFLSSLAAHSFIGGNVTIPHKEAAFRACRQLTPVARRLEAANTLWLEGERLYGDNTDGYGFASNLDDHAPGWRGGSTAVIVGAGGASRAVIQALCEARFGSVIVVNRTPARAEALAHHFGMPVRAEGLERLAELLPAADIIVNATSAGMEGHDELPVEWRAARPDAIATDLVYVPLVTPFLRAAAERGLHTVDGLGMLLHQAVPGFERWFGIRPEVDAELRSRIVADLSG